MALETLKKRREFQRVKGGPKWSGAAFLLDCRPSLAPGPARFGFTVTKKLAPSAVVRNRMRRRLKEAVRLSAPGQALAAHDYVVVARAGALDRSFEDLCRDFKVAFERLAKAQQPTPTRDPPRSDKPA
jgi:ribonuclease P protein component